MLDSEFRVQWQQSYPRNKTPLNSISRSSAPGEVNISGSMPHFGQMMETQRERLINAPNPVAVRIVWFGYTVCFNFLYIEQRFPLFKVATSAVSCHLKTGYKN